jgi:hypothetical protein
VRRRSHKQRLKHSFAKTRSFRAHTRYSYKMATTGRVFARGMATYSAAAKRRFFVGGNWKANGSRADVQVRSSSLPTGAEPDEPMHLQPACGMAGVGVQWVHAWAGPQGAAGLSWCGDEFVLEGGLRWARE